MGLNIYFCDVCGVRVTEVDLRSGHGMRQIRDVICATCLEIGHGREWLASRGLQIQAAGTVNAAAGAGMAVIDAGRDRARTVPDPRHRILPEDDSDPTVAAHPPVRGVVISRAELTDFAGAAAGFAALGQQPESHPADHDGHLAEESSDVVDPALLGQSPVAANGAEHLASTFVAPSDDDESSALINVKDRASAKIPAASGKSSQSAASARSGRVPSARFVSGTSGKASTAAARVSSGKQVKTSSSRTLKGKPSGGLPLPLKLSLITVPLILIAAYLAIGPVLGHGHQGELKDMAAQKSKIDLIFKESAALINAAVGSHDVGQMKAARDRWNTFQHEWELFAIDAKQYSGWTEENCDQYWDGVLKAHDVQGRIKLLNDDIAKQSLDH